MESKTILLSKPLQPGPTVHLDTVAVGPKWLLLWLHSSIGSLKGIKRPRKSSWILVIKLSRTSDTKKLSERIGSKLLDGLVQWNTPFSE
jgi:hypothetical protein